MCAFNFFSASGLGGLWFELSSSDRVHANKLSFLTFVLKLHNAFDQSEERIVLTAADIVTRLPLRSTLPRENVTAKHVLAAELLEAEALRVRVATVAR